MKIIPILSKQLANHLSNIKYEVCDAVKYFKL